MIGGGQCDNNVQIPLFADLVGFVVTVRLGLGLGTAELGHGLDNFSLFIHLTIVGKEGRGD